MDLTPEDPRWIIPACSSEDFPVPEMHAEGLYLFQGQHFHLRNRCADCIARKVFSGSNPPPKVWAGLDGYAQGMGTEEDARVVDGFQRAHFVDERFGRAR